MSRVPVGRSGDPPGVGRSSRYLNARIESSWSAGGRGSLTDVGGIRCNRFMTWSRRGDDDGEVGIDLPPRRHHIRRHHAEAGTNAVSTIAKRPAHDPAAHPFVPSAGRAQRRASTPVMRWRSRSPKAGSGALATRWARGSVSIRTTPAAGSPRRREHPRAPTIGLLSDAFDHHGQRRPPATSCRCGAAGTTRWETAARALVGPSGLTITCERAGVLLGDNPAVRRARRVLLDAMAERGLRSFRVRRRRGSRRLHRDSRVRADGGVGRSSR